MNVRPQRMQRFHRVQTLTQRSIYEQTDVKPDIFLAQNCVFDLKPVSCAGI